MTRHAAARTAPAAITAGDAIHSTIPIAPSARREQHQQERREESRHLRAVYGSGRPFQNLRQTWGERRRRPRRSRRRLSSRHVQESGPEPPSLDLWVREVPERQSRERSGPPCTLTTATAAAAHSGNSTNFSGSRCLQDASSWPSLELQTSGRSSRHRVLLPVCLYHAEGRPNRIQGRPGTLPSPHFRGRKPNLIRGYRYSKVPGRLRLYGMSPLTSAFGKRRISCKKTTTARKLQD